MKKSFICSVICHNGIVGGVISIEDKSITFNTNKLTIDVKYRNLSFLRNDIVELSWKWIVFPIATFKMKYNENYKFIIFNKKRFNKWYNSK